MTTTPGQTVLDGLLQAMGENSDFPALSDTITKINKVVGDDTSRADILTEIILRDVSLTNKLLRMVNTTYYGSFGSQRISTISRAVVILGFDAVRDAALSLLLFEHLQNHAQADKLREVALECLFCAILGRLLGVRVGLRDSEEAFISALFRNLGRLLARYHFYPQTQRAIEGMQARQLDETAAVRLELGVDYDQLGLAVAKLWHFPPDILHAMRPLYAITARDVGSHAGRMQVAANMAHDLQLVLAIDQPLPAQRAALDALRQHYREAMALSHEELIEIVRRAGENLREQSAWLKIDIRSSAWLQRLLPDQPATAVQGSTATVADQTDEDAVVADAATVLALGMQDLTVLMLGPYQCMDIYKMVVELFYRTECFDHVLMCLPDPDAPALVGRIALGQQAEPLRTAFRIPITLATDLFQVALVKGEDTLISDVKEEDLLGRLPDWYGRASRARSCLLLPMLSEGKPIALLYADSCRGTLQLSAQELGLLKALRNQAILACARRIDRNE